MNKSRLIRSLIAWGLLLGYLFLLKPENLPVFLLIPPFLLLWFALYNTGLYIGQLLSPPRPSTGGNRTLLVVLVATSLVVFVGLQSIGELALRDVVTVVLLAAVSYFYVVRNTSKNQ